MLTRPREPGFPERMLSSSTDEDQPAHLRDQAGRSFAGSAADVGVDLQEQGTSDRVMNWWTAVLMILLIAIPTAGAYLFSSRQEPVYAARSEIIFDLRNLTWDIAERVLATRIVVAQSRALLVPTADSFGVLIPELAAAFSADTIENSGVIRLQYLDKDRGRALGVMKSLTSAYLTSLHEFESQEDNPPRVLTPPFLMDEPVSPKPLRTAALGLVIGLTLAALVVVLRSQIVGRHRT
jgi:uncharacterized protein involved in exopolysaccharide biosynthesis